MALVVPACRWKTSKMLGLPGTDYQIVFPPLPNGRRFYLRAVSNATAAHEALRALGGSARSAKQVMRPPGTWVHRLRAEDPETRQAMLPSLLAELPEEERKTLVRRILPRFPERERKEYIEVLRSSLK